MPITYQPIISNTGGNFGILDPKGKKIILVSWVHALYIAWAWGVLACEKWTNLCVYIMTCISDKLYSLNTHKNQTKTKNTSERKIYYQKQLNNNIVSITCSICWKYLSVGPV